LYHQIAGNKRKSVIVVIAFLLVWLLAGVVIGELAGGNTAGAVGGAVVLGALGILAALYAYYLGAPTVLAAMGAKEADPQQYQQLYNIVQTLAIGDGLPMPKVYVIDDPSPNAFATGRDPKHAAVTVTAGLLQMMNREELEGVLSHEMSHIKNYDVRLLLVVTTMIGLAALISSIFWRGAWRMGGGRGGRDSGQAVLVIFAAGIIFTLIAFVLGPLMQLALSRDRESLADASGVELTRNPVGLISALKKIAANDKPIKTFNHATAAMLIDNPTEHHGTFFNHLFDTHPPIEERIAALEKIASVQQT
jgi:heat shock protein HtpX